MLRVGLTGGIASGKSVVAEMFARLGAHVIQADRVAHELMQPGQPVYAEVVRHFGSQILAPDGRVDRQRLAAAAFGDPNQNLPSRVEELNRIVHPAVLQEQDRWMAEVAEKDPAGVAMVEAALIVEAQAQGRFQRLVVVRCRDEQRVERFAARLNIGIEEARREVQRRMRAQISDGEKAKVADYVIDNSGSLDATEQQVREVYAMLRRQAAAAVPGA